MESELLQLALLALLALIQIVQILVRRSGNGQGHRSTPLGLTDLEAGALKEKVENHERSIKSLWDEVNRLRNRR